MSKSTVKIPFSGADILLPEKGFDKWAVIACDQYTSEREYWENVKKTVADAPSALNLILPEVYLCDGDTKERTEKINAAMNDYLKNGIFKEYKNSMVYVERKMSDGRIRHGIVGAVDLSEYDYNAGATTMIRATEGTVLSRIPPRVKIRKDAPLELPHVMILIDDPDNTVIPKAHTSSLIYDTELMLGGGSISGSLLTENEIKSVEASLCSLAGGKDSPLLFAVGDGNHSLATAKACYDENNPLSHYALAEIVNIHDPALDFEPIYRVVFSVDAEDIIRAAKQYFADATEHKVVCHFAGRTDSFYVDGLAVGSLQNFIDEYLKDKPKSVCDYIHGVDSTIALSKKENTVGFIFDGIGKSELFPYVEKYGSLPRKTFSMGEANDKRFYMECRKIK